MSGCMRYWISSMTEGMAKEVVRHYDTEGRERRCLPPSSVRRSKRLIPRPFNCASWLVITGGSCLWSPMSATCWDYHNSSSDGGMRQHRTTYTLHEGNEGSRFGRHRRLIQEDYGKVHHAQQLRTGADAGSAYLRVFISSLEV